MAKILKIIEDYNPGTGFKKIFSKINEIINRLNNTDSASYKKYVAILNQTGTNPPVPIVLENTLGVNPLFIYDSLGSYRMVATGLFLASKTVIIYNPYCETGAPSDGNMGMHAADDNDTISITSMGLVNAAETTTWANHDDLIINTSIEIRVYE